MNTILKEIFELADFTHSSVAEIYSKYYPYECNSIRAGTIWNDKVNSVSYTDDDMMDILFSQLSKIEKQTLIYTLKTKVNMLMGKLFQQGVLRELKNINYRPIA